MKPDGESCVPSASALSLVLTGYMYDTLVYYAYVKQYMEASKFQSDAKQWENLLHWTNEAMNPHLNYVGELVAVSKVKYRCSVTCYLFCTVHKQGNNTEAVYNLDKFDVELALYSRRVL